MMHIEEQGDISVISLKDRLDGATMGEVEKRFLELIAQGKQRFVFDLSKLDYISSAGLRVMLLSVKKTKAAGGKLALCALGDNVLEVFQISGFTSIFSIFSTCEEALAFAAA